LPLLRCKHRISIAAQPAMCRVAAAVEVARSPGKAKEPAAVMEVSRMLCFGTNLV
jgi:hypothetical protein